MVPSSFMEPTGQGLTQVGELGVAFLLSAIIGLERELQQKAAGVRTYTVVGLGSALFMLVSKYGFTDVLVTGQVVPDPSRVAAQIVSGLGFIGAGIIFVRRGSVRGLTTAASVWLTAAVGAAAGAGLVVLASLSTAAYFAAIWGLPPAARVLGRRFGAPLPSLRVHYLDGRGLLRDVLSVITRSGFSVSDLETTHHQDDRGSATTAKGRGEVERSWVEVRLELGGRGDLESLVASLTEMDGILEVATADEMDA
jgi:putative Mg2+ transporter-C (MgtC) family protein